MAALEMSSNHRMGTRMKLIEFSLTYHFSFSSLLFCLPSSKVTPLYWYFPSKHFTFVFDVLLIIQLKMQVSSLTPLELLEIRWTQFKMNWKTIASFVELERTIWMQYLMDLIYMLKKSTTLLTTCKSFDMIIKFSTTCLDSTFYCYLIISKNLK